MTRTPNAQNLARAVYGAILTAFTLLSVGCPNSGGTGGTTITPPAGTTRYKPEVAGSNGTFKFDISTKREDNVASAECLLSWQNKPSVTGCTEVTYIQVVRSTDSQGGHPVGESGQEGRKTDDGWSVDKFDADMAGGAWYPVKADGTYDPVLGGPGSTAGGALPWLGDNVSAGDTHWPIQFEFVTCAICKTPPGQVLDCVYWGFTINADGSIASPTARPPTDPEKQTFKDAIGKWNEQANASGGTQPPAPPLTW